MMTTIPVPIRRLSIVYGITFLLALTSGDSSSIDPLNFLEETDCSYVEPLQEEDAQNPSCSKYRISTLNSNPRRCMHIVSNPVVNVNSLEFCNDFVRWTDGSNGCLSYSQGGNEDWCEKYGDIVGSASSSAKKACCVCGGGKNRHNARYQVGDLVKVPEFSQDCVLKVTGVVTSASTYTFEIVNECYNYDKYQGRRIFKSKKKLKLHVNEKDPTAIYRNIELRKCRPGLKEQEFWVIPQKKDDETSKTQFIIQHVTTGATLTSESSLIDLERVYKNSNEDGELGSENDGEVASDKNGDTTFHESEQFVYIRNGLKDITYLTSGKFGESDFSEVKWSLDGTPTTYGQLIYNYEQPFHMWSFTRVEKSDDDHVDQHSKWLEKKIDNGHLSHLKQLAPWHLLDIERDATKNEVKSRFRMLSRDFHPDKRGGALFNEVFMLLQEAYDGLKKADEREKEDFRTSAEVESQLFPHSEYVVELLPSDFKQVGNGTRARYVISTNSSDMDIMTGDTSNNETDENEQTDVDSAQVWLLFLYSPRCSMSRIIVSFLELAAKHLHGENIRVGAYGCGIYGQSLDESKKKGFVGWMVDPICKQYQRRETPNSHVIVEALSGSQEFKARAAKFASFYGTAAKGSTKHMWPRRFIDFAMNGKRGWDDSSLVEYLTRDDFESPSFHNETRLIFFANDIEGDGEAYEVQDAILAAVPHIAHRLQNASIRVSIASCATESEDDPSLIDCSTKSVSWLPDIKVYGVNETRGHSLISEDFVETRDAQIALEAMTNTLAAQFRLDDEDDSLLDEEVEEQEDGGEESQCEAPPPMNEDDEDVLELDEETPLQLEDTPEDPKIDNEPEDPKIDGEPEQPKIEAEPEKPMLADGPAKPKLAQRQRAQGLPNREKRRPDRISGGGKVLGGSGSQGGGGAIAG